MNMKMIWVTFQRPGIHLYPQAAHDENLQDVKYLGYPHRHLFKFQVSIEVHHDDREIEFHQFLNFLESQIDSGTLELNNKSCEMIADDFFEVISQKYNRKARHVIIDVSEDGECGAKCAYFIPGIPEL